MNNKGFAIVTALLMLLVVSIVGATGLHIVYNNLQTTQADEKLNRAEKAANAGLLRAVDEINSSGFCFNREFQGNVINAQYNVRIKRSGRICFVKSEGTASDAKIIKTSIIQSFYGLGLYTVRGNVDAQLGGASVRLSGCDDTVNPTCFVPAFIASGTINPSVPQRGCGQDGGGAGLYGNPAIFPNVFFDDLIPLFFNVDCFNVNATANCGVGLLQVFEDEPDYGRNPQNNNREIRFDNEWGIPRLALNNPTLPPAPNIPSCTTTNTVTTLNLTSEFTACSTIRIPATVSNNITISGNGMRGGQRVTIYDQRSSGTKTINANTSNFILSSTRPTTINTSTNFAVYNSGTTTVNNSSAFMLYNSGTTTVTGTAASPSNNFNLYNTGTTTYTGTIRNFRHVSSNTVTTSANASLSDGTLIIAPLTTTTPQDAINTTNNVNVPLNLITAGNITLNNMKMFVRSLQYANNSTVNIWDSLVYVYANACPNCSRAVSIGAGSSLQKCDSQDLWCGWVGNQITLNIGRGTNDEEMPVLFITNNTTVKTQSPPRTSFIWGVFVGEDVTYLRWTAAPNQSFRGFLIRNFPRNLTLNINIASNFTMEFRQSLINTLAQRYWFFRKVDCIQDDMNPWTQMIQTGISAY